MEFKHRVKLQGNQGSIQQFREKAPGQNWEKIIDLTSKHNYGSKIYPKNQISLDCFMPSTSVFK